MLLETAKAKIVHEPMTDTYVSLLDDQFDMTPDQHAASLASVAKQCEAGHVCGPVISMHPNNAATIECQFPRAEGCIFQRIIDEYDGDVSLAIFKAE